jgi:hypothetical protein
LFEELLFVGEIEINHGNSRSYTFRIQDSGIGGRQSGLRPG